MRTWAFTSSEMEELLRVTENGLICGPAQLDTHWMRSSKEGWPFLKGNHAVRRLLSVVASLVVEHGPQVHGLE